MWPDIVKNKKGIGVKFEERFWDDWGPTDMFYFNSELFNDSKSIQSIYCMYLPHNQIKFNPDEIAMGLHYQCGEFGEHTVLFSYEEIPRIEHSRIWDFCVFKNLNTDHNKDIDLYNYQVLKAQGKMSEEEIYKNYLENHILLNNYEYKNSFRELSSDIIKAFMRLNPTVAYEQAYLNFLENLAQRISGCDNSLELKEKILKSIKLTPQDFDRVILEIVNETRNTREQTVNKTGIPK